MKKILFYLIAIMNIFHFSYAQYNGQKDLIQIDNDNEPQIIDVKWMNER